MNQSTMVEDSLIKNRKGEIDMKIESIYIVLMAFIIGACGNNIQNNTALLNNRNEVLRQIIETSESETEEMKQLEVEIGTEVFTLTLYDNETTRVLKKMMPFTIKMSDLNGNEKYYYLDKNLPTNAENVGSIQNGDFMLYGANCLVLFYENFNTSYSYTPLGKIDDPKGFYHALGKKSVMVTFRLVQ